MSGAIAVQRNQVGRPHVTSSLRYFRVWAALLFLISFALGPLVLFTFGFASFAALAYLWVREPAAAKNRALDRVNGSILIISSGWFLLNLVIEIRVLYAVNPKVTLWMPLMAIAFLYPPIIMQSAWFGIETHGGLSRRWQLPYRVAYPVSFGLAGVSLLAPLGLMRVPDVKGMLFLQLASFFLFVVSGVYGGLLSRKYERRASGCSHGARWWSFFLYSLAVILFVLLIGAALLTASSQTAGTRILNLLSVLARSLPLCFFFVGSYYEQRFTFFDIFIKRGTYLFLLIIGLVAYLSWLMPLLDQAPAAFPKPRLFALFLLPVLFMIPWGFRKLESLLDRAWLGRSFSTVDAVKYFLNGVQDATSEEQLVSMAEERLSEIFQAESRIRLAGRETGPGCSFAPASETPIVYRGDCVGAVLMGRRANDTPYFSADLSLLGSLADVFCSLLENVRLQGKKQEQERKEQALMLHASRSELKALRAQVNPHFLFNALNAIAGLIPGDPERAEATVEQLAEVFRYTLKRSEKESVRLEEEMDFVRSYLDVEQARFGRRLQVRFDIDAGLGGILIPTMTVQTLVENAVKHGIACLKHVGVVEIRATSRDGRIRIEVLDNGPGFLIEQALKEVPGRSGYGLRNLTERLNAHYGSAAQIHVFRDGAGEKTIVSIDLPANVPSSLKEPAG